MNNKAIVITFIGGNMINSISYCLLYHTKLSVFYTGYKVDTAHTSPCTSMTSKKLCLYTLMTWCLEPSSFSFWAHNPLLNVALMITQII